MKGTLARDLSEIQQAGAYQDWLRQRPYDRIVRTGGNPRYFITGHGSKRTKLRFR